MITYEQIERLLQEAASAGDMEQVAICERALEGDNAAFAECERVIGEARAMEDT